MDKILVVFNNSTQIHVVSLNAGKDLVRLNVPYCEDVLSIQPDCVLISTYEEAEVWTFIGEEVVPAGRPYRAAHDMENYVICGAMLRHLDIHAIGCADEYCYIIHTSTGEIHSELNHYVDSPYCRVISVMFSDVGHGGVHLQTITDDGFFRIWSLDGKLSLSHNTGLRITKMTRTIPSNLNKTDSVVLLSDNSGNLVKINFDYRYFIQGIEKKHVDLGSSTIFSDLNRSAIWRDRDARSFLQFHSSGVFGVWRLPMDHMTLDKKELSSKVNHSNPTISDAIDVFSPLFSIGEKDCSHEGAIFVEPHYCLKFCDNDEQFGPVMTITGDGSLVLYSEYMRTLKILYMNEGRTISIEHESNVRRATLTPDNNSVLIVDVEGFLTLKDLNGKTIWQTATGYVHGVSYVDYRVNTSGRLCFVYLTSKCTVFDMRNGRKNFDFVDSEYNINIAFIPDSCAIISADQEGGIYIRDGFTGDLYGSYFYRDAWKFIFDVEGKKVFIEGGEEVCVLDLSGLMGVDIISESVKWKESFPELSTIREEESKALESIGLSPESLNMLEHQVGDRDYNGGYFISEHYLWDFRVI